MLTEYTIKNIFAIMIEMYTFTAIGDKTSKIVRVCMDHNFGDQEKIKQACASAEGIPWLAGLKIERLKID